MKILQQEKQQYFHQKNPTHLTTQTIESNPKGTKEMCQPPKKPPAGCWKKQTTNNREVIALTFL